MQFAYPARADLSNRKVQCLLIINGLIIPHASDMTLQGSMTHGTRKRYGQGTYPSPFSVMALEY